MGVDGKMDYEEIRYEVEDGRARITLARPKKHNAMTPRLLEELEHALWEADDDCSVHCVVLRGEGASFCSGYDLTALGGTKRQLLQAHHEAGFDPLGLPGEFE
jgi:enoyl-CoA hydratase/carnithine racemase